MILKQEHETINVIKYLENKLALIEDFEQEFIDTLKSKVDIDNVFEHPSGRKIILSKCVFDCSHGIDLLYKSDNKTRCNVNRILRYHSRN